MKEMRPTWSRQHAGEAPFWEIIVFSHTWRSNIKAETRGTYTGKLSQQFYNSISYFSTFLCILLFWLPNFAFGYSQRQSRRVWEKQIYKNRSEYYHCLYFYRKPAFCIGRQIPRNKKHLRTTHQYHQQYIQRTTFAKSKDPEKTNIDTVKMMEAKCEVIVIILIDKSGYYLQGCWCCFSISYWVLSSFLLKKQRNKSFLIISMKRRKKESRHSFGKESTIWQWLKAEGTKNVSSARTTIFWTQHSTLSECRKQSNI